MPTKLLLPVVLVCLGGCQSTMFATTGRMMSSYAVQHVLPSMMESADLGMACGAGVSMGGFLMSFERVAPAPDKAAVMTLLSAGMCAESEAWEAELRGLRKVRAGDAGEALDARIQEKTAHRTAAHRFHAAYEHLTAAFGPLDTQCPRVDPNDEVLLLLGLSAGVLATLHDRAADGSAGVPTTIPLAAARASLCLSDSRWWGAPMALRAAVWTSIPGSAPSDADPWQLLSNATRLGDAQAVRLARAFAVQANAAAGRDTAVRDAITQHALALKDRSAAEAWRMLDSYATRLIEHESDKLWTQATGHRTPTGRLGAFWDDSQATDDDGMFDAQSLGDAPIAPPSHAPAPVAVNALPPSEENP